MSNEIKIRSLTVKDRKKLSALIQQLAETVGDRSLFGMISSQIQKTKQPENPDDLQEDYIQIGLNILKKVLEVLEDETHDWFADLIGVSRDEFIALPFDTETEIIEQIVNSREVSSFFTKALQLFSRIKKYQNKQGN